MAESRQKGQDNKLLEGITQEAEQEAERIRDEAERQAREIVENARRKADEIRRDAQERGEQQGEILRQKNEQNIQAEQRKRRLKVQEDLFTLALQKIRETLQEYVDRPEYAEILKGWITEGAIGLGQDELIVNGSASEREILTDSFLKDVEKDVEEQTGRRVKISLSDSSPLQKQGVLLSTQDGRLAFNNVVEARLQRYSTSIRKMIYERIRSEERGK